MHLRESIMFRRTDLWTICIKHYFPARLSIRCDHTKNQYKWAIKNFGDYLGRIPTVRDLTDDNVTGLVRYLIEQRGLAARTANERRARINALWSWLAKRGRVKLFPTNEPAALVTSAPHSWSEEDLQKLFGAARTDELPVGCIPGNKWWPALLGWLWNTSERIGATLALEWDHIDLDSASAVVPAHVRKGAKKWAGYTLWPETVALLREIEQPQRELVFPWPYHPSSYWKRYSRMLRRAGLPDGRKYKSHAMRVSHATWVRALSGEHAKTLGHSSSDTTVRHYEDPRIAKADAPALFIPWRPTG